MASIRPKTPPCSNRWPVPSRPSVPPSHPTPGCIRPHPTVCLDLRSDDWLQIRAFASAIPGWRSGDAVSTDAMHFEWTGARGWVPCIESTAKSTAPGADPIWLELPDPDRVAPIVSWLESLDATNGSMPQAEGEQPLADDREFGTWMRLTPSTIDKLADAWGPPPGRCHLVRQ